MEKNNAASIGNCGLIKLIPSAIYRLFHASTNKTGPQHTSGF